MDGLFRHYKNAYYQRIGEALDTRDNSMVIVYRTLYPSEYSLLTRPKEEFYGRVNLPDGSSCLRFTPVSLDELPETARAVVVRTLDMPLMP